jgi:hypothetical protein
VLGVSEPNLHRVGHSWDAARLSIEPMSIAAGHTANTNLSLRDVKPSAHLSGWLDPTPLVPTSYLAGQSR